MPNFYDTLMSRIMGPQQNYGGLLDPNAQTAAQNDGRMAMAAQLLQAGGWSPHRVGIGQAIGSSITAGQQAQQQSLQAALQAQLLKSQIARNERGEQTASQRDFEYFSKLSPEQQAKWKEFETLSRANGKPASIQEFEYFNTLTPEQQEAYKGLQRQPTTDKVVMIGNVPHLVNPITHAVTPLSSLGLEATGVATVKGAGAAAEATQGGAAKRVQTQIDAGLDAADALATVKRGQQLLESIGTGGIDRAKLAITQAFGVTGADESELSANLGKAVLSQLRATFGAQFTEKEGQRLAEIEAGFGKSTEGNKRLLAQAEKILDRAARRGLKAAEESGDAFTAEEIRKAMEFSLDPNKPNAPSSGKKRYNPATGKIE